MIKVSEELLENDKFLEEVVLPYCYLKLEVWWQSELKKIEAEFLNGVGEEQPVGILHKED